MPLDEDIVEGQVDHIADHEALHAFYNDGGGVSVLEWDGTAMSVDHGEMWEGSDGVAGGVAISPVFWWEAWVCYLGTQTGYWISEGHGGAHAILAGFSGAAPSGNTTTTGSSADVAFTGDYTAQVGEWMNYVAAGDGTNLYVLINGVPVAVTALTQRKAQYGPLLIGGSDHNNFIGRIAMVRGFEGWLPTDALPTGALWGGYVVERHIADSGTSWGKKPAHFAADYTNVLGTFADLSGGFRGQLHHGRLYYGNGISRSVLRAGGGGVPQRVTDRTAPFGNQLDVARARTAATPAAVPAGAKVYDSFGRADSIHAFTGSPAMGDTEGGSLGTKTWSHTTSRWGVFDGAAISYFQFEFAVVAGNSADCDLRCGRRASGGPSNYTGLAWRVKSDRSDGYKAELSGSNIVVTRPSGTTLATWTPPNNTWTHLRIVVAGNDVTGYIGSAIDGAWTSIGTVTDGSPANASETRWGIYVGFGFGAMPRWTEWGAF